MACGNGQQSCFDSKYCCCPTYYQWSGDISACFGMTFTTTTIPVWKEQPIQGSDAWLHCSSDMHSCLGGQYCCCDGGYYEDQGACSREKPESWDPFATLAPGTEAAGFDPATWFFEHMIWTPNLTENLTIDGKKFKGDSSDSFGSWFAFLCLLPILMIVQLLIIVAQVALYLALIGGLVAALVCGAICMCCAKKDEGLMWDSDASGEEEELYEGVVLK